MARVTVSLLGRAYPVACDDGQESRVRHLASLLESRLNDLKRGAGAAGEAQLLVMMGLILADELEEQRARLRAGGTAAGPLPPAAAPDDDPMLADVVGQLANHVEAIAARLRRA